MSTPNAGPGRWEQGNFGQAMGVFADMDESQQRLFNKWMSMTPDQEAKLDKVLNKQPLRAKITATIAGVVSRVNEVYDQQTTRLSEAAQQLASQARDMRQAVVGGATLAAAGAAQAYRDVRDPVVATYNRASEQVADLVDRGAIAANRTAHRVGEGITAAGQAVVDGTVEAGRAVGQRAQAVGRGVAEGAQAVAGGAVAAGRAVAGGAQTGAVAAGRAVAGGAQAVAGGAVAAGEAVVGAGQRAAARVSRWIEGGQNFAQRRSESARAAVAMFRYDASQPAITTRDTVDLTQRLNEIAAESTVEGRDRAWASIRETIEAKFAAAQGTQGAAAGQDATMAHALGGMAQAGGAVPAQATGPQQGNDQGAQANINLTKNTKDGPSIGG